MPGDDRPDALAALGATALRLARGTASLRVALAYLDALVDPRLLPEGLRAELAAARAEAARPIGARAVERTLRAAWGARPTDTLDDLDPEPLAVTASAQVHGARLDGEEVVVKVLRPGLRELVRSDLTLADALVRPAAALFGRLDPAALVAEARERILDELDLEHEASVQRAFHRALRRHETLRVPAPVTALAHPDVLVARRVRGTALRALADPARRHAAAQAAVRFHVGSARFGTVHADPHPDNALLGADGRWHFVDFGATRRVEPARVDLAVAALAALRAGDGAALGGALGALGWLPTSEGARALALAQAVLGAAATGPATLDGDAAVAAGHRAAAHADALAALATKAAIDPADLWPLRMLGALAALLLRLAPTLDAGALALAAARDGWS